MDKNSTRAAIPQARQDFKAQVIHDCHEKTGQLFDCPYRAFMHLGAFERQQECFELTGTWPKSYEEELCLMAEHRRKLAACGSYAELMGRLGVRSTNSSAPH